MRARDRFWWTAQERERVRAGKEAGDPVPWTADPVLQKGRFCNVYRHHDRTSVTLQGLLRSYDETLRPALAICLRLVNRDATLRTMDVGQPLASELPRMVAHGINTNAYRINTPQGLNSKLGVLQLQSQALGAVRDLERARHDLTSFRQYCQRQGEATGITAFIGYQAALDLRDLGMTHHMEDDWAYVGPGAVRGLLRVNDLEAPSRWDQNGFRQTWVLARPEWVEDELRRLDLEGRQVMGPGWSIHETEGWLCEFDKYERLRLKNAPPP